MTIRELFNAILDINLLWIFGIVFSVSVIIIIWGVIQLRKIQLEEKQSLERLDDIWNNIRKKNIDNESGKN